MVAKSIHRDWPIQVCREPPIHEPNVGSANGVYFDCDRARAEPSSPANPRALNRIAGVLRQMLDSRRGDVQGAERTNCRTSTPITSRTFGRTRSGARVRFVLRTAAARGRQELPQTAVVSDYRGRAERGTEAGFRLRPSLLARLGSSSAQNRSGDRKNARKIRVGPKRREAPQMLARQ